MNTDFTLIKLKRSDQENKVPTVFDLDLGELAINTYDAKVYTKRYRPNVGTDIIAISGAGPDIANVLYVTADGNDNNSGKKLGDAKRTIKSAVAIAPPGTLIKIGPGTYIENNPIELPDQVSLLGDTLREVSVTPLNSGDLFYVGNGNYIWNMSFVGAANTGAIFAFNPNKAKYINQSPYIQNCTNFIPNSIGLKVDGSNAIGPTKSMVLDSYTQYNQGGIGVSITNEGYAQLVSLFTICNDVAIYCGSGGACDLNNSNSSFGNYGLVGDGVGPRKYTGTVIQFADTNSDTFVIDVSTPTKVISNVVYDNVSGVTTVTTSTSHGFSVGMGISLQNAAFLCPSSGEPPDIPIRTISGVSYSSVTGIATITTLVSNHRFSVGMGVSLSGIGFTSISNPSVVTYPTGDLGYVFRVDSVPASNQFTVNIGVSTLPYIYNSGGTAQFLGYTFPSGNNGNIFEVKSVPTSNSFVVNTGPTGLAHTYTGGGIAKINVQRPYEGQVVYFNDLYYSIGKIIVGSGGTGYTSTPTVTIDPPSTSWGIQATGVAEILNGSVTSIQMISNGRGYTSAPTITISSPNIGINTATASVQIIPDYYTIQSSTVISSGICTIKLNENVPYAVGVGTTAPFFKQSRILASAHSFEYVGSGIQISSALPSTGGVAIQENEIDMRSGGLVIYTSTDQSGNFRIGDGVVVNQNTGTISGAFYSKSLFSAMTPYILALGGN
jgi:hypothetical protein